jgi:SAM-dependent methyltransferase
VTYHGLQSLLPKAIRNRLLYFEAELEKSVEAFATSLPPSIRVLDAGAGEARFAPAFISQRYTGVDLAVGDQAWNYTAIDALADLAHLPFRDTTFDAALNVVTLEHVAEPRQVLSEIARTLRPGAPILLVAPHEWEEHQQPHDFYRYTRYGLHYLLTSAGFSQIDIRPVGGFFRLLARRLLNGTQFFPPIVMIPLAGLLAPIALLLPALEPLDKKKHFTLGFICTARKS